MLAPCGCFIIPDSVIKRYSADKTLSKKVRAAFVETRRLEPVWRKLREAHAEATLARLEAVTLAPLSAAPSVTVNDCKGTTSLPGAPIAKPGASKDGTVKRAFNETREVAKFYKQCFGRNSIDNAGMTMSSSVHYGQNYNNAFWNGSRMSYGDGDGQIFIDFTLSNDVVAHELTHGVTQYTAGFVYTGEPGALNESMSDVFGSMYRQWSANQAVTAADWLIGSAIMGATAKKRGYTCLRDLANPGGKHCMAPQPSHYSKFVKGGGPHTNSGIPNQAFYQAAMTLGGKSWERVGKVWYAALTAPKATTNTDLKGFAKLTRAAAKKLFAGAPKVFAAVDVGWTKVGL
jgi:Zn-dependent metalloprotease